MNASVDPAEIERFNALADQWWDPTGPMWPLHRLNATRVPYIVDTYCKYRNQTTTDGKPLTGVTVLDIGCGAGLLSESMASRGAQVTAVDPAERNIAIAKRHAEVQGLDIDYRCGSVENLDSGDFDLVLNMEVVEHVDELPEFMAACCNKVAAAGMHIVATINRNPLSWLVAIVGAEYVLGWLPKGTHQWRKFVTPAETEAMLRAGGMSIVDKRGISVSPFTRNIRVVNFTGVNYMMASSRDE
ncbi:MAG: bifunctional 2-polyprenyl-6-hydroxyphenol methylase/3-demethylubiquinol 3-O-methyltransferase UbiG [Pseudomonadota bacterium]